LLEDKKWGTNSPLLNKIVIITCINLPPPYRSRGLLDVWIKG